MSTATRNTVNKRMNRFRGPGIHVQKRFLNTHHEKNLISLKRWLINYFNEFLTETSFHAFIYFTQLRQRPLEVVVWMFVWLCAAFGAVAVVMSNWERFQSNPTVISFNRNYMKFETTFPAATVCYKKQTNDTKMEEYINEIWKNTTNYSYYKEFIETIAKANLSNFKKFSNDSTIPQKDYYNIALKIQTGYHGLVESMSGKTERYISLMTEHGICYAFNSAIENYSHDRRKRKTLPKMVFKKTTKLKSELGTFYFFISYHNDDGKLYAHAPTELPVMTNNNGVDLISDYYSEIHYLANELVTSEAVRLLSVRQRRCRFPNESDLKISPVYSVTLCRLQCRIELAKKICGCSPYFYPLIDNIKECNIDGLICISNHIDTINIMKDPQTKTSFQCNCLPPCNYVYYTITKTRMSLSMVSIQISQTYWKMTTFPRAQLNRNILYGPTDLLVSFGGTAGLFLGCSLLSGVETIYFFTLRMVWQLIRDWHKLRNHP